MSENAWEILKSQEIWDQTRGIIFNVSDQTIKVDGKDIKIARYSSKEETVVIIVTLGELYLRIVPKEFIPQNWTS